MAAPPNTMLMLTSDLTATGEVYTDSDQKIAAATARMRSMTPIRVQLHHPDSSFLWCSCADMIERMPAIVKNPISSRVSDMGPLIGHPSRMMATAMARTAERSDRPPEAGRVAFPERGDQAHDSTDQEQPTQVNNHGQGGGRRDDTMHDYDDHRTITSALRGRY